MSKTFNIFSNHVKFIPSNLVTRFQKPDIYVFFINLTQFTIDLYNYNHKTKYSKRIGKDFAKAKAEVREFLKNNNISIDEKTVITKIDFAFNDGIFSVEAESETQEVVGSTGQFTVIYIKDKGIINKIYNNKLNNSNKKVTMSMNNKGKLTRTNKEVFCTTTLPNGQELKSFKSTNEDHCRVYNFLTSQLPKTNRKDFFEAMEFESPVGIDLKNSIFQAIAKKSCSYQLLNHIKNDTFIDRTSPDYDIQKKNLCSYLFSMLRGDKNIPKIMARENVKSRRQAELILKEEIAIAEQALWNYLSMILGDCEASRIIQFIKMNQYTHEDLFEYENLIRDFCRENGLAIPLHDCLYFDASIPGLLDEIIRLMDNAGYIYSIEMF